MSETTPETMTEQRIDDTYREAMDLALQARAYIFERAPALRAAMTSESEAVYAAETMRMSTRIMHVVAWALNRKALAAGEIDESEAETPERRLGGEEVCAAAPVGDLRVLPDPVQEMVLASRDLYDRAARLERMLETKGPENEAGQDEPAVHTLWREIEDLGGEG